MKECKNCGYDRGKKNHSCVLELKRVIREMKPSRSPGCYQDLKDRLLLVEASKEDAISHAARLADALMDINNLVGEDIHVKSAVEKVDSLMREYAGIGKSEY